MKRNALYIFLILLLATALTALAQSPTSSSTGGSETKDPYGATLDHPNPTSSAPSATAQPATEPNIPAASAPMTTPATTPSTTSTTTSTTVDNTSGTPTSTTDTSGTAPDTSTTASGKLPRTASDLPLLATMGLLALGGALTVRSLARRNT